jgi:hypothetical protein
MDIVRTYPSICNIPGPKSDESKVLFAGLPPFTLNRF